jgi:hypothetical protein
MSGVPHNTMERLTSGKGLETSTLSGKRDLGGNKGSCEPLENPPGGEKEKGQREKAVSPPPLASQTSLPTAATSPNRAR